MRVLQFAENVFLIMESIFSQKIASPANSSIFVNIVLIHLGMYVSSAMKIIFLMLKVANAYKNKIWKRIVKVVSIGLITINALRLVLDSTILMKTQLLIAHKNVHMQLVRSLPRQIF